LKPNLYITDLDGTLLQKDGTISEYTREKIHLIIEKGIPFTIATARSITSTKEILGDIPFQLPVICSNGGTIFNYHTKENLHVEFISTPVLQDIIPSIKKANESAFVSGLIDGKEHIFFDELTNEGMHWFHQDRLNAKDERLNQIEDIRHYTDHPITTITFMNRAHHLVPKKRFYQKNYSNDLKVNYFENKYSEGWYWLSLHSVLSTKRNAIQKLKNLIGMEQANLTVFGDEMNDLSMFEIAHKAIAVGNALHQVKKKSHQIIGTNQNNSVVDYILAQYT
jgi:Cof subfamily protein (haloacid dehalogenase superfamily)